MSGPPPKDPSLRERRNKVAGAGVLEDNRQKARVPPLPRRRGADGKPRELTDPLNWLPETRAWWRDLWRSPMAARFLGVEVHGLHVVAQLRDDFWRAPSTQLASEIRQQEARWGLDQLARWRLQWEVVGDAAMAPKARTPDSPPPSPPAPADDPRKVLNMPPRTATG
jgi:hypothetical protein